MKTFVALLLCVSCVSFGATKKITLQEDMEMRNQIALRCIKQIGIDKEVVEKAKSTLILPRTVQYKDFLACSYKKQGFQNQKGEMLMDNLKSWLTSYYQRESLEKLNQCDKITGPTHGDVAFESLVCIVTQLKSMENDRLEESSNEI